MKILSLGTTIWLSLGYNSAEDIRSGENSAINYSIRPTEFANYQNSKVKGFHSSAQERAEIVVKQNQLQRSTYYWNQGLINQEGLQEKENPLVSREVKPLGK